jgi:transcriptional regulator with GAF, ATPase, and Fis domain
VELEAGARLGRAEAAYLRGEHAEARRLAEEARAVIEAVEEEGELDRREKRTLVQIRNLLGRLALYRGDVEVAKPIFESNLALARELDWEGEIARAEVNLAVVDLQRGNFAAAADALEQLRLRTPGPKGDQRAALLINLGMAAQRKGKFADSLDYYRAAIREAKRVEYDEAIGAGAYNLATLMAEMGAYDEVGEIIERLEQRQLDQHRHMFLGALPQILRANLDIERGAYLEALETLENVDLGEGDQVSVEPAAKARLRSVQAHVGLGQIDHAKELLEGADFAEDIAPGGPVTGLEALAEASIALAEESWQQAADKAREAAEELREAGHFQDAARASVIRCRALMEDGRTGEASSYAGRRLSDFQHHAESIPEEFHTHFYSIPVYRELVELNRELTGDTTEPYDRYVEAEEAEEKESFDTDTEAFRRWRSRYGDIVGEDERLLKVFRRIDQVAVSDSPVLIQGESGTGKELIAEAIYQQGEHGEDDPFVKVNCGAFVDNLLLSELFGHEKGAFTGAVERKVGRFEKADGGVIFLDEIGEISQKAQVALLRVLQEGEFERVGGTETRSVDVRIICATNRDLESMVENGEFRLDLYYRLKGVLLELPPLRERRQDIPRLVKHFAAQYADEEPIGFDRDVLEFLASYTWPGNIRELKNFVRSILLFVDGDTVEMEHLRGFRDFFSEGDVALEAPEIDYDVPVDDYEDVDPEEPVAAFDNAEDALVEEIVADGLDLAELKKRIEYQSICRALKETGGNITRAAEILKMTRPRLSQIVNSDDDLVALKERLVG